MLYKGLLLIIDQVVVDIQEVSKRFRNSRVIILGMTFTFIDPGRLHNMNPNGNIIHFM